MLLRGIKSRVFVHFWLLFLIAMLFIDLLVFFLFEERMVDRFIDDKREALAIVCEYARTFHLAANPVGKRLGGPIEGMVQPFFYLDADGRSAAADAKVSSTTTGDEILIAAVRRTLASGKPQTQKIGKRFGWLLPRPASVIITLPLRRDGRTVAAGGTDVSLTGIFTDLQRIHKIALVFVVINSFFFALIGNRQLSRIYFRPLQRLARRAESYQDEDVLFFSVRKEDNEFAVLSASLNKMLDRIAEDRRVLNETIDSLTSTNAELKQARNDVIRAEKLATVGRLTSGIAHEIGNPIGIVLGYLDLLKQPDLEDAERCDFIVRSEAEITRIHHIIRQLLDMSRSSSDEAKPVSVHLLLGDLIAVFGFQPSAAKIRFEDRFAAVEDTVHADPDRLRQVFLNILLNAVDAVSGGSVADPRIVLATRSVNTGDGSGTDGRGASIVVTIRDNGPGIDADHLPRIFDPFFTTKAIGKGTGLGLSVADMIIEKIGGKMTVSGDRSAGAVFHVTLPLVPIDDEDNPQGTSGNERRSGP